MLVQTGLGRFIDDPEYDVNQELVVFPEGEPVAPTALVVTAGAGGRCKGLGTCCKCINLAG